MTEEPVDQSAEPGRAAQPAGVPALSGPELRPALEALLLLVEEPVSADQLAAITGAEAHEVAAALAELADFYDETGRGFQLRETGGGWRYYTRPEHHDLLSRWAIEGQQNRLTQAGLETLAIIAYFQPVPRSRVSAVRGVNVDSAVRTLIGRGLVEEVDTDASTGAGLLATTPYFLERLGLRSLDELPDIAPLLPDASALEAELVSMVDRPAAAADEPLPAAADRSDNQESDSHE